jgi:lipoprotein-releasing system ATP-binding protein
VNGRDTSSLNDDQLADLRLSEIGFVFQSHFLLPEFSALENLMIPMQRLGRMSEDSVTKRGLYLLNELGLSEQADKYPHQLSGGQSQRVAIGRALANDPALILADEPTGNLDTVSSSNVQKIMLSLAREHGRAVIIVTHDAKFAASADRIITLVDGRIVVP